MNRRILLVVGAAATVIVVAIVALVLLGGARGALEPPTDAAPAPSSAAPDDSVAPTAQPSAPATATAGVYRDYSPEALATAQGRVLLFFHAPWCPQCRSIESDVATEGVPDGVTILVVDYDTHQELRQKYGVTLQTSFVEVDTSGEALQPVYVAYSDPHLAPTLAALL